MILLLLGAAAAGTVSCATQRKLERIRTASLGAELVLPEESRIPDLDTQRPSRRDTLQVVDFDGREMLIMKAVRDEDGEMVATDVIDAAVVTARFRNVAERHGKVDIGFQVRVPREMQDSRWQLRFYPDMYVLGDSLRLESVVITGADYRKAQLRGYQQYERFLSSIVQDTTRFINIWQLELFLERNIPEVFAFKRDSSYVSDEQFRSVYGATEREAVEHYTNIIARSINEHRKKRIPRMYQKYVKAPIVTEGLRLDTVMRAVNGDFIYNYTQTIATRPQLRKVDVVLSGDIWEQDRRLYDVPRSEPLTFYISSLSSFADGTERYLTKVIERRVEANTACYVDFAQGSSEVDLSIGSNASEMGRIRGNLASLMVNETFDLDSVIVVSSASPEGSVAHNDRLSGRRSASISAYLDAFMQHCRDSIELSRGFSVDEDGRVRREKVQKVPMLSRSGGENWQMLDRLVAADSLLTDTDRESYATIRGVADADLRERLLQGEPYYRRLREHLYPRLRTVRFDFHLHRKGMVKDTVHTTVLDSVYMAGVQAIRDRDYEKAVTILRPYNDYNAAVAFCAMDYNQSALAILQGLGQTAQVNYMLAIIYARLGDDRSAVQHYLWACTQESTYVHRGNLDPEISALISRYGLNAQDDDGLIK